MAQSGAISTKAVGFSASPRTKSRKISMLASSRKTFKGANRLRLLKRRYQKKMTLPRLRNQGGITTHSCHLKYD